jgi:oxygen-dependent protoporphyrinogen oxidase
VSDPLPTTKRTIAVIGGGISGLATAYYLQQLCPSAQIELFEAQPQLGGVLQTGYREGCLHEWSADNFLVTPELPWAMRLAEEIGYADQMIETNTAHRRALVYWNERLHPIPEGFQLMAAASPWPILRSSLLTWRGKLRLGYERFVPPRLDGADESLQQFATRRVGREAYERLVQPLVAGIYTADPERLSVAAALPQFPAMEKRCGSLTSGMRQRAAESRNSETASGARYSMFFAPRQGMSDWIKHLAAQIAPSTIHTNCDIHAAHLLPGDRWKLVGLTHSPTQYFDGLVLAVPTWRAAKLLGNSAPELAAQLMHIRYANAAVVSLAIDSHQLARPVDAFGIVIPAAAHRQILAISFSSVKFPGRAPEGKVLVRVFVGGACQEPLVDLDDSAMRQLVLAELRHTLKLRGEPLWIDIRRWYQATPQYELGHLQRIASIEQQLDRYPTLALAGNGYRGVGIPQCIQRAHMAAARIASCGDSKSTSSVSKR